MKLTLEELYDMLSKENPEIQIELRSDGNVAVTAPDILLQDEVFMETLEQHITRITSIAASMGMFFPSEVTDMLDTFVSENGEKINE